MKRFELLAPKPAAEAPYRTSSRESLGPSDSSSRSEATRDSREAVSTPSFVTIGAFTRTPVSRTRTTRAGKSTRMPLHATSSAGQAHSGRGRIERRCTPLGCRASAFQGRRRSKRAQQAAPRLSSHELPQRRSGATDGSDFGTHSSRRDSQHLSRTEELCETKTDVRRLRADCDRRASSTSDAGSQSRIAKPPVDGVRSGRVHRMPRGDGTPRIPARSARLATIRCQRKEVRSERCPRLDSSRSADQSVVAKKGENVCPFERFAREKAVARVQDATTLGGST